MNLVENFKVLAINHKASVLDAIGCYTKPLEEYEDFLGFLIKQEGVAEAFYLSTCNRVEIWLFKNGEVKVSGILDELFSGNCIGEHLRCKNDFFELDGELALLHMVNVSSSLDSMVIGEREIFGQIRRAFIKGKESGAVGKFLGLAMRKVTEISKEVYSSTEIAHQKVSVASIACQQLRKFIPNPIETKISLIGAGDTIRLVSRYLSNHDFSSVNVFNRSMERAEELGEVISVDTCFSIKELNSDLLNDVVITCTGSTEPVILPKHIEGKRNYIILDLAIPSDTSKDVMKMKNVRFIGVEDIKEIAQGNIKSRLKDLDSASTIAHKGWLELIDFLHERSVLEKGGDVFSEVKGIFKRDDLQDFFSAVDQKDREKFDEILKYVEQKYNKISAQMTKKILID